MSVRNVILLISGSLLFLQSCSIFRGAGRTDPVDTIKVQTERIELACAGNNISGEDLIIGRTKIEYRSAEMSRSGKGFIKHKKEGDLLLSLRSLAGIEVARAYLGNDSIKILDRINGDLYIQSADFLELKLGVSSDAIGLLWGDLPYVFIDNMQAENLSNEMIYTSSNTAIEYEFIFDDEVSKLKEVRSRQSNGNSAIIKYEDYIRSNDLLYPQTVTMNINEGNIIIELSYGSIKRERIKSMKFSKGNNPTVHILR
jgi:hypothetical protein